MKHTSKIFGLIGLIGLITFSGCKDDDPSALTILSITSIGTNLTTGGSETVDLNGTTSPTNVPTNGIVTATFSKAVNGATVTATSITLSDGTTNVPLTVATTGAVVTITPTAELVRGTLYTISITSAVTATDGGKFTEASRTFTTAGRKPPVIPQSSKLVIYVPFDGVVTDQLGHTIINPTGVTFTADRFGTFAASADFNGTTNYVGLQYKVDLLMANQTISYWIKLPASAVYNTHVRTTSYVTFALGGNDGYFHEFGRFDDGPTRTLDFLNYRTIHVNNGTNPGLLGSSDENKQEGRPNDPPRTFEANNLGWLESNTGKWLHIVTTYNATTSTKTFYFNGQKGTEFVFTPNVGGTEAKGNMTIDVTAIDGNATNSKNLYIGSGVPFWATLNPNGTIVPFRGVPHAFKGQMDDFRIFGAALTSAEVLALYNAEKP
jgi:Bacterial Ig-like domain